MCDQKILDWALDCQRDGRVAAAVALAAVLAGGGRIGRLEALSHAAWVAGMGELYNDVGAELRRAEAYLAAG